MECRSCSAANPDSNRFCESCGTSLAHVCAACGYEYGVSARFCGGCGAALNRPAAAVAARPAAAATPGAGWGELKQATVLFADIVSSTEQIALLDPEEAMERLQPAVMLMCEAVERFGGTVMRTLGDGVMALFGVPKALEGHATLACEAALHMQSQFAANPQGLSIRVGLHSGLVASDPNAMDGGKGGGAHGMTIHLASRVVGVASPGGVALTGDCYSLVRSTVDVQTLGAKLLKGISEPIEIFSLTGLKPQFTSQQFHQAKLTPLRGREKEIGLLQGAYAMTEQGNAQVIGISGGPGTGKSRLGYEFVQWVRAKRAPVFEVRAQLYGSATPLQPVLGLMRTFFFGISETTSPQEARDNIARKLAELGPHNAADEELVCQFLGVANNADSEPALNVRSRRTRLLSLFASLVKVASTSPCVLLFEDLHWLDEASEEFVATLVGAVAGTRTMLVLNYRSSYRSPWLHFDNFQQLDLVELSASDTDALVRELISHRKEFKDISRLIVERSGGNPFFAEELVRSLAEGGVLSGDPAHPRNGIASVERAMPVTVQAVIGARIDRLSEADKSLLQMCAIVGKDIPIVVLQQVAGLSREELERGLEGLCAVELVQPLPALGGRRFAFRHPLIQEVAYSTQLKARRAQIHAAVAKAMEGYYGEQLDEFSALVGHHYEAAGQMLAAAEYTSRAARWLSSADSAQAMTQWHKVRVLLQGLPKGKDCDRLKAMACSQISLLGWREGLNLEEVQPFIEEAMALADEVDPRLVQLLYVVEGRMLQASGGPADWYAERIHQALALIQPGTDHGRVATLNAALSQAYGWSGLLAKALEANDVVLANARSIDAYDHAFLGFNIEHWALGMRGRLLTRLGRFDEAREHLARMLEIGEMLVDPVILQIAHYTFVDLAWCSDDAELAQAHSRVVAELADKHRNSYMRVFAISSQAMTQSIRGDFEAAAKTFQQALQTIRDANVSLESESEILASLAECHRRLGDHDKALLLAEEAISMSRQRSTRLAECRALLSYAALMMDMHGGGRLAEAEGALKSARQLTAFTGAKIYEEPLAAQEARVLGFAAASTSLFSVAQGA